MLVNRIFVIDNSTGSKGRQVDRSTSRQINIAKIYKCIGMYSPSGNTRAKCKMGKRAYLDMSTSQKNSIDQMYKWKCR